MIDFFHLVSLIFYFEVSKAQHLTQRDSQKSYLWVWWHLQGCSLDRTLNSSYDSQFLAAQAVRQTDVLQTKSASSKNPFSSPHIIQFPVEQLRQESLSPLVELIPRTNTVDSTSREPMAIPIPHPSVAPQRRSYRWVTGGSERSQNWKKSKSETLSMVGQAWQGGPCVWSWTSQLPWDALDVITVNAPPTPTTTVPTTAPRLMWVKGMKMYVKPRKLFQQHTWSPCALSAGTRGQYLVKKPVWMNGGLKLLFERPVVQNQVICNVCAYTTTIWNYYSSSPSSTDTSTENLTTVKLFLLIKGCVYKGESWVWG